MPKDTGYSQHDATKNIIYRNEKKQNSSWNWQVVAMKKNSAQLTLFE